MVVCGNQLPALDGESVLDGVYWGRGVSYWDCRKPVDGQTPRTRKALRWARGPKSNLVNIDLYDVADLPDVYRRKILSGHTALDHAFNPHLAGVRIAAYGRIEAHEWKKATFSTARGAKLFAADGGFVAPGLTDAPPGLAQEGPLSWWRMTSRGDASTMYQVMTIGGDHKCQPNENGIVARPVNAQYRLYHNPKLQPASFRPNYDCAVAAKPSTPPPEDARAASL
ncbi:MAG: hypothetical protein M1826_002071 [Phylliscum demangeonii]|nr:MAG: hypothetical protein M1826_002071 [Phylliscum demangeonii]